MSEYDFTIEHRKGTKIAHADALSRYPYDKNIKYNKASKMVAFISPSMSNLEFEPIWDLDEWKKRTTADKGKPEIDNEKYINEGELIYRIKDKKKLLWVPYTMRTYVIKACHDPPAMGHRGVDKTYAYMKENLYWNRMEDDIREYIRHCEVCQKFKKFKHMSPTQRVPVPVNIFEEVSMDIVGPVPSSSMGNRYILVIQNRLSR